MAIYSYSNRAAKRKRYLLLRLEGKNRVQHCLTHTIFQESPIVVTCPNAQIDQRTRLQVKMNPVLILVETKLGWIQRVRTSSGAEQ